MMSVTRLDAPFGVEVTGLDIAAGLDDAEMRALAGLLHDNRLLVIRDQELSKAQYLAFGRRWGAPIPHALDHLRMPGYPELMEVGNTTEKDRKEEIRNGAVFWHTDQSYEAEPSTATMLYCRMAPETGGETQVADLAAAYDTLDDAMKARLDGLVATHLYGAASGRGDENIAAPITTAVQRDKLPSVRHRIARPHPVTGRVTLYAVAGTPYGVEGLADDEARDLLDELKAHALQARFIYRHKYRVGDIAIWDTSQTLHSGVPIEVATGPSDSRLLWRISVRGVPTVCA